LSQQVSFLNRVAISKALASVPRGGHVLSGASSRTPVEMVFDMGLGDIFCARVLPPAEQQAYLDELYRAHVLRVSARILQESTALKRLVQSGQLKVVGGMYDVRTGTVDFFEPSPRTVHVSLANP
jgi:carbonic anhydrase